jgi:hypothetical protein
MASRIITSLEFLVIRLFSYGVQGQQRSGLDIAPASLGGPGLGTKMGIIAYTWEQQVHTQFMHSPHIGIAF